MSHCDTVAVEPVGRFDLTLRLPGSKSLSNRALLLAALADGCSCLDGVLFADDTRVMIAALQQLGFKLEVDEPAERVKVEGRGGKFPATKADLHLGNAGTAMRFLSAAVCLGEGRYRLDGIPRMRQRPIGQLVDPLRELGAEIAYGENEGYPPLEIQAAGLRGGAITLKPTLSSQYISAMLQAAPGMANGLDLHFDGPVTSLPYVLMTVRMMARFGVQATVLRDGEGMLVTPGSYHGIDHHVEPDASNASYFLAAAAIRPGARVRIEGLGADSMQGDVGFAGLLEKMGAEVKLKHRSITVTGPDRLAGIDVDLNDMPDMAQTLAVVALFADGPTVIRNVGNLRVKETDRLEALRVELGKLGALVRIDGDDLHVAVDSPGRLTAATIDTYDDHRMAMAFAVAGLGCEGVTIADPDCVNKTFPGYWDALDRLRAAEVGPR